MRSKILCILVVTLAFNAIASGAPTMPVSPAPAAEREEDNLAGQKDPVPKGAFVQWRRIGLLQNGRQECPQDIDGWTTESLLDLALCPAKKVGEYEYLYDDRNSQCDPKDERAKLEPVDRALLHDLGLDRFCVFTAAPGSDPLHPKPLPPGLIKTKPDRIALSTTSAGDLPTDTLSRTIWQALATHFREQTLQGRDATGAIGVPIPPSAEPRVRLTFIDSQPEGEGFPLAPPAGSPHGFTLAYLARGVVCPIPERCAALVATRRALSFQSFPSGAVQPSHELLDDESGHVGLVGNLAMAIVAEVVHWRRVDQDKNKKLILNLSLGWDGEVFEDLKAKKISKLDPSVQAVYKALRFARRSGVLVIAAAGNRRGGMGQSKAPLLPAAWELKRPTWLPFPLGRKPVYAVGGVDWQGLPLPNSRRGGFPRRVAYADHAVAATETPSEPTAIFTGTSVSAAVASSIAAVVWHLRPDLSPSEVMRLVTKSGNRLPSRADFYAWNVWPLSKIIKAPPAKGLSLCRAVARACRSGGSRCLPPTCPPWVPEAPGIQDLVNNLGGSVDTAELLPSRPAELTDVASQRWVTPQPEGTPSPGNTLLPESPIGGAALQRYTLVLEISEQWTQNNPDIALEGATFSIDGSQTYKLTAGPLTGGLYRIPGLAEGESLTGRTAWITFTARNRTTGELMSILNPVLVDP